MKNIFVASLLLSTITACGSSNTDSASNSSQNKDPVAIVPTAPNSIPVAEAGIDQNVLTTTIVTLDASASSDYDGDTLSYSWSLTSLPENSSASLNDSSSAVPTFTVDLDGKYTAQLVVNDGTEDSVADTVIIIAETANSIPIANAGNDQNQAIHNTNFTTVILDGSGSSDADYDVLTYAWSLVSKPEGSDVSLTDSTNVTTSFIADMEGDYIFSLTVNDGELTSEADNVTISFSTYNSTPTVNPGSNQTQFDFSEVQLNGSGNDSDSDLLTYEWSFKSKPAGSFVYLNDTTSLTPTFIPDAYGDYVLALIANDGYEDSLEVSVVISVKNETEKGSYLASNVSGYTFSSSTSNINGSITGSYGFIVKNENTQSLNWTRFEVISSNGTIIKWSTDPTLLGGNGVLSADENQSLSISVSSVSAPLTARYYFTDSTNSTISFIVDKEL